MGKVFYKAAECVNGEPVTALPYELKKSQWYSLDQLKDLQWIKLNNLIHVFFPII
jgi:hypothetical protein